MKADLVLLDFVMPRMNGYQFCRAVRQTDGLAGLPIVLMSAKGDRIRDQFVQQTGAVDAITKPFDAQALVATVENALRRVQTGRASATRLPDADESEADLEAASRPIPPTDDASRVALAGDLAIVPIGAVLQMLQLEGQSGVLTATNGSTEITVTLRGGLIDLAQSKGTADEFRLGRYLVEEGLVSAHELGQLLAGAELPSTNPDVASPETARLLGYRLLQAGRITEEQLRAALTRQASELAYELLRWQAGRFEFRRKAAPPLAQAARLGLAVASVVMEGFRRVDEWRHLEATLGSFEEVLVRDPLALESVRSEQLPRQERIVLDAIDGERTIRQIVDKSHLSSFDACRVLVQLLEARLVRRRREVS